MFLLVPVVMSIVAILAAFEVLAAMYLPGSKTLFALITGAAGLIGTLFVALTVSDSWHAGPSEAAQRAGWLPSQWIKSHAEAYRWTQIVMIISIVPAVLGMILRLSGIHATPTTASANWLVGSAFVITMASSVFGILRSRSPVDGTQNGLRHYEAFITTLGINLYLLTLMILLP